MAHSNVLRVTIAGLIGLSGLVAIQGSAAAEVIVLSCGDFSQGTVLFVDLGQNTARLHTAGGDGAALSAQITDAKISWVDDVPNAYRISNEIDRLTGVRSYVQYNYLNNQTSYHSDQCTKVSNQNSF